MYLFLNMSYVMSYHVILFPLCARQSCCFPCVLQGFFDPGIVCLNQKDSVFLRFGAMTQDWYSHASRGMFAHDTGLFDSEVCPTSPYSLASSIFDNVLLLKTNQKNKGPSPRGGRAFFWLPHLCKCLCFMLLPRTSAEHCCFAKRHCQLRISYSIKSYQTLCYIIS